LRQVNPNHPSLSLYALLGTLNLLHYVPISCNTELLWYWESKKNRFCRWMWVVTMQSI